MSFKTNVKTPTFLIFQEKFRFSECGFGSKKIKRNFIFIINFISQKRTKLLIDMTEKVLRTHSPRISMLVCQYKLLKRVFSS